MPVAVRVRGVPDWADPERLLGPGPWAQTPDGWTASLERPEAADLKARLRGVGIGGASLEVDVQPPLKRKLVRDARTADARRRRVTTPGFTRPGCRLDDEGRMSLTAEPLALAMGRLARGRSVLDACGGCGGNAIGFARAGCEVTLVEPDGVRLELARHNAGIYGVADRITFVRGRVEDVAPDVSAEIFFADPPWGADWSRAHTDIEGLPLMPALLTLSASFDSAWLKLPPSFDVAALPTFAPTAWYGEAPGDRGRVKFLLLSREPSRGS